MTENHSYALALVLGIDPSTLPPPPAPAPIIGEPNGEKTSDPEIKLVEEEFHQLLPYLPPEPRGAGALSNLQVLNALLWSQSTRRALTHLPSSYGQAEAVRKRQERWALAGVGEKILQAVDGVTLRPGIKAAIKRCAASIARRGERIKKSRSTSQ